MECNGISFNYKHVVSGARVDRIYDSTTAYRSTMYYTAFIYNEISARATGMLIAVQTHVPAIITVIITVNLYSAFFFVKRTANALRVLA